MFSSRLTSLGFAALLLSPAIALASEPSIAPISLQQFTSTETTRTITVDASDIENPELTFSARIVSFGHGALKMSDSDYRNWGGLDERWVLGSDSKTWYFVTPDGAFYEWNKSGQSSFTTGSALAKFPPSFHADLSLLVHQSDYGMLKLGDNDYRNWGGLDERWILSKDNTTWYFITPDGSFYRWNSSGQAAFTTGPVLATFPQSFHADLSRLISHATLDVQADGNVSVKGNELTVTSITSNAFGVEVTASDAAGKKSTTTFGVVRPAAVITINPIPLQILAPGENEKLFTIGADNQNSAQNTYQARIVSFGHGALKKGDNDHRNWGGLDERWVMGKDEGWYFITPDGSFYRWNSSGQEAFTTGPVLAKFPASFHADLSQLVNQSNAEAQEDGSISVNDNKLTVNAVTGKPFGVEVLANSTSGNKGTMTFGVIPSSAETSLGVSIDGPMSRTVAPDDNDVVFANVVLTAKNGNIDIKKLPVFIEVQGPITQQDVDDMIEDIELRNIVTGRVIKGIPVSGGAKGYMFETFVFENFTVSGTERFELRADMTNNGPAAHPLVGDRIRAKICAESSASTTPCNFDGLGPSNDQKISAVNLATNKPVSILPGGIVAGNIFSVARARLDVTVKATGTSDTASKNQKNINLLRFEARASETDDTLLYQAVFQAQAGSLSNAQNYTLWVDTNNDGSVDTILQKGAVVMNDLVDFNSLVGGGYILPKEKAVIFEVHADVTSTLTSSQLQLKFATSAPKYVGAEKANDGAELTDISTNGSCAGSCQIFVTTTDSTVWNFVSQGNLYVTKSATPVRSHQLLGGTLTDEILRVQFSADTEDVDVTDLVLTATGPNASTMNTNVDRLELYKVGATTPFATASIAGCGTSTVPPNSMCASLMNQELVIAKGSTTNVLVRPRMRTDDNEGAVSGHNVQVMIDAVAGAKARGLASSNTLAQNDGDAVAEGEIFIGMSAPGASLPIVGTKHSVVLSKIVSITNSPFADPEGSAIPVGFAHQIGQFKFDAAANTNVNNGPNKVQLSDIIFNVTAKNVATDPVSYKVYNRADASIKAPCTVTATSASDYIVTCNDLANAGLRTEIDQGTYAIFVLETTITNPKVSASQSSLLQVSLQNFTDAQVSAFDPAGSHLRWLDEDNGASTPFLWIEYPDTQINGTQYQG